MFLVIGLSKDEHATDAQYIQQLQQPIPLTSRMGLIQKKYGEKMSSNQLS